METQTHMEMAHEEIQEDRSNKLVEEITEEQFLKNLYLFMKKRDSPIERIPHLGFKQIDLFVMFKTVKELGGYHQVTSQQLWKQVYNTLGGNPRSTSAATCTRRHYEKLLLPYECHVKGLLMNVPPRPKHFQDDYGQRPAKRKPLPIPQHLSPPSPHSHQQVSVFPLNPSYHKFYYSPYTVPAPYAAIPRPLLTPHCPPAPQPFLACPPAPINLTDRIKDPLEQLRFLAKQYTTPTEPLNLSFKASSRSINSNPVSSFAPPSSSKNPKFLNKPSPLYTSHHPTAARNEGCEMDDGGASLEVTPFSDPLKGSEECAIGLKAALPEDCPTCDTGSCTSPFTSNEGIKSGSPKTDFTTWSTEERDSSPGVRALSLSHILPSPPEENGDRMEIEIPLSVFNNWLRMCEPQATLHGARQLLTQDEHPGQRNGSKTEVLPTNLTFQMNPREADAHSAAEDLRLSQRNTPDPTPTIQATSDHHMTSQYNFPGYKSLPSGGILKNAASRDVYPLDEWDNNNKSYSPKPTNCWESYNRGSRALPVQVKMDSSHLTVQRDFAASKSYNEVADRGGKERPDVAPPAVLMLDSNSASLLHFTTEEVMKLKKIISSTL